jgi:arylformamidase
MRFQDYPPQDPPSGAAAGYRQACIDGSFGVPFAEFQFGSDPHQSIAIYPAGRPRGEIFAFIHGGGWTAGYKETMGFMAPAFTAQGITFASIGYRLAPDHVFPAGFDDCAAGVKLLCERAADFGSDPGRVFVGGHSSGGHYAALLAVNRAWTARFGVSRDVIKGCLPISGVYRFGEGSGLSVRPRFLGPEGNGAEAAASPIGHIADAVPFLIAYGENDFPHLRRQAAEMEEALRAASVEVESIVLPGCNHFTAHLAGGDANGIWVPRAIEFIRSRPACVARPAPS